MASKLSGLGAVTGTNADDLVYLASTQDAGTSYTSKRIKISNLFSSVASGTDLGTFTGAVIADNASVKSALQALETALESEVTAAVTAENTAMLAAVAVVQADVDQNESDADAAVAANEVHIDNIATLTGLAKDSTSLGNFTGSTITNGTVLKTALQELETAQEAIDAKTVDSGNNVNVLVANTTPDATPATFYFLAVDAASGAIKVVNKDFVAVE